MIRPQRRIGYDPRMNLESLQNAKPETAVVLGSGLGTVAESLGVEATVPYSDVPGLPVSKVPGHSGRFVLVRVAGRPVLIAQGRSHLYEGLSAREITAGVRFMAEIGVKKLVLTNAAGTLNAAFAPGQFMMLSDHINLLGTTPLLGGPHFYDMTEVYSRRLRAVFHKAAEDTATTLHEGVYAAMLGPQYETPAEIRMLRTLGADAVGMSTVPEAIQARALGLEVAGISILTNWAAGMQTQPLNHAEVIETGRTVTEDFTRLLKAALAGGL
jgi:purine-nucleoside phosphorylase